MTILPESELRKINHEGRRKDRVFELVGLAVLIVIVWVILSS
jgi:hypothetical protein